MREKKLKYLDKKFVPLSGGFPNWNLFKASMPRTH